MGNQLPAAAAPPPAILTTTPATVPTEPPSEQKGPKLPPPQMTPPPPHQPLPPYTPLAKTYSSRSSSASRNLPDQLLEIFQRLPNLPALVRAALTCRPWLGAVCSSRPFRRLFRALHPVPRIGLFIDIDGAAAPSFVPLRRSDPDVIRHGYILLWNKIVWNKPAVAEVNPMTWAVDIIPVPGDVWAGRSGRRRNFAFLGFHLLSSDEKPSSFRVVCVCADKQRVRVAVFSPETRDWAVHPWVHVGGDNSLKSRAGMLVGGCVYWPFHGEGRMIRINTATMEISFVDLPSQIKVYGYNFKAGETKDVQLCIVYASDDFLLHVWIRSENADGIEIWVLQNIIYLSEEIDEITEGCVVDLPVHLKVVQVRSGYVYLSATCMTHPGTLRCWFISLSLETMEVELLVDGCFGGSVCPYVMAWPPCLVGDDGSIGHEVEGPH